MPLKTLSAAEASALVSQGATLVDIRSRDEFARMRLPGAMNLPLDQLQPGGLPTASAVIFHCRSGNRTRVAAELLEATAISPSYILDGGLDAWRKAGLPVEIDRRQPLEIMRQVQLVAGGLVLLGVVLGFLVAPGFFGLSAFVGAGLMFAGATGWCGMARLLILMPWNRQAAARPALTSARAT